MSDQTKPEAPGKWVECPNCGRLPPDAFGVSADDEDADEADFCRCELCYICGEDTQQGRALCACDRRAAGSGP